MEIYLMQHGPNLSEDEDPEESLSPEGEAQVSNCCNCCRGHWLPCGWYCGDGEGKGHDSSRGNHSLS
jgi:hypothetical protein